jgi:DNA polymerase-3 subunit gamma/tau
MYQVIARKYRPASFSELVSQEHVRTTLENAIRLKRIAHGYILAGQRGTGKTTVARIIARCLNCIEGPTPEPCGNCPSCREVIAGSSVDVIEIDAASNRGINEMRELRDNVRFRPARDRYKVFIIDEAHQITSEAFNALLKTLEEPPEWAVFILCTTEAHKIPATIASRCQQFSFRSVGFRELVDRMRWICQQEGIQADEESLAVLAQAGEGSVRDSLSALDQAIACCGQVLKAEELRNLLGRFSQEALEAVARALQAGDARAMLEIVGELEGNGRNLHHFCRELARYFRNLLVLRLTGQRTGLVSASDAEQDRMLQTARQFTQEDLARYLNITLEIFREMQQSLQPRLHLEMGLVRLVYAGRMSSIEEALAQLEASAAPEQPTRATAGRSQSNPALRLSSPRSAQTGESKLDSPAKVDAERRSNSPSLKAQLVAELRALGMTFTADAVEHSEVAEKGAEISFLTPREFRLAMSEADLRKALDKVKGPGARIKISFADIQAAAPTPSSPSFEADDDVVQRALSHPEVKRFQELFPDAQVRAVRNLKE